MIDPSSLERIYSSIGQYIDPITGKDLTLQAAIYVANELEKQGITNFSQIESRVIKGTPAKVELGPPEYLILAPWGEGEMRLARSGPDGPEYINANEYEVVESYPSWDGGYPAVAARRKNVTPATPDVTKYYNKNTGQEITNRVLLDDKAGTKYTLTDQGLQKDVDPIQKLAVQLRPYVDPSSTGGAWGTKAGRDSSPGFGPEGMMRQIAQRFINATGVYDINDLELKTVNQPREIIVISDSFGNFYIPKTGKYLTDKEKETIKTFQNSSGDGLIETVYTAEVTLPAQGIYNKKTGQLLAEENLNSSNLLAYGGGKPSISLGGWGEGPGLTYGSITFGDNGKPKIYTSGEDTNTLSDLGPILAIASLVPSPIQPFAIAANALIALDQGDVLGAVASVAGLAGLKEVAAVARVAKAVESGDILGAALAAATASGAGNVELADGVSVNDVLRVSKAADAISKGDFGTALVLAGQQFGSQELIKAGQGVQLAKAIASGNPSAIANAAGQVMSAYSSDAANAAAKNEGWTGLSEKNTAINFYGPNVTPDQWNRLGQYIDYSTGEDNLANSYKSLFGRSQAYDQFYEFGLDPNEFKRIDTIDDALKAGQSAFISAAIDAYGKGTMSESELRSELRAAGISDSNTSTLVNVAKDAAAKQERVNTVFRDLLDPGSDLSLEGAAVRLKEAGLTDTQVSSAIQSITNDFSKASELRTSTGQIIDDYTAWNSDLSREKALERLVTAGVSATRANELLGLVDTQVESQRYLKEVGREAVQRYAAGDISREDAELALQKGSFPVQTVKTMIEYANAIKEGRQLTPGEMEVAAANNLNQWFNVGSGYQVRVARAEDGTIGLVEARDAKGNNITNAFIDPYTQKLMLPTQVPQRVATATNVQVPVSYPEFQRLINPQAIGNVQFDKNTGQYFTVDDNGNRLLTLDPSKLPVATPENYHAYLTTWGILKNKGLPLPDPRGYATTTAQQTLPPLLQTVGNALSIPTEAAGRFIGNLGAALETFGVGAQRMTEFGNSLANQAVGMRDEEKQQADLRVVDRFRNATTNAERGRAIFDSVLQDPGAVLRMGGVEVFEELPNIAALAATGGGSALVRLVGMGATQLTDALIESYGGAANEKIQEGLSKGKTRDQAVADAAEDARKAGGITFLANALANKIPFGGTATKEILKNAFIEAPEEFLISKALGDDTNTALNKSALALMISPTADAGLRSSGGVVNLVATPQGLQATYADGAKITIGERDGQVTTAYDLPTTNLINNLVTDALASNQSLPTVINEQLDILSNVNISDFMPTIVSAASNYANPEDITNALITASIENGSFDQSLLTSVINSSLDIPGATDQRVIDGAIGAMLAANQTPQVIANSMFTSGLNSGLSYNTTLNDVTSSLLAKSIDPAATLGQIIPIASQVGLTAGQTPADVANAVFNTALQAGKTANLNATDTLSSAINQTYNSLIAGGLTPDQASIILGAAASQSGTSNNLTTADVLTSINTGITQAGGNTQLATANVVSGQLAGLQTQYNQLSEAQKQIADNLVSQGSTLQDAITKAKSDLSTEIGEVRTDLQSKIDNLTTEQKAQFDSLSEAQRELAITLANQGTDLATAITDAVSQLGTQIGEVKTDFQTKYDALTQTQKAQFDALTQSQKDLAAQLATQGTDLATAINTAKTELKTEIGDVKTGLETQIGDIKTQIGNKIDALAKTSADADQVLKGSIDSVAADLGLTRQQLLTQLGTTEANLKTEFKTQLDTVQTALQQQIQQQTQQIEKQTAQQKEDARLQRIATGSAAALAIPGLMGQATKQPFIESPSLKSEVTGGIEDPLAKFMKIIQGEPQKAPEVPQPPLGGDMSNTFTYGKQPPSYDELFSNQEFAEDPDFVNREELILPYKAGGSPLNIQMMYAKGGDPREDFRHGKHVAGPGDGQSDDIPAWLADGEYVLDAEFVSALGNGSTKAGVALLDELRRQVRAHKRSGPLSSIPPKSKSPLSYLMDAEKVLKKK